MTTPNLSNVRRVLVVRLGAIGDTLRVLPAVRRLRIEHPGVTIGWVVEQWAHPVLAGNPNVDHFHVVDRRELQSGPRRASREVVRVVRRLQACDYDLALDFHGRLKSGFVSRLSGAPVRVGYASGDSTEGNHLFNNIHVRLDDRWENRVLRFLRLLQPLGIEADFDPDENGLYVPEKELDSAREWYRTQGRPVLAAYPGTSQFHAYNRWPKDKWVDLLRRLGQNGVNTVLFWGPAEADWVRSISEQSGSSVVLAPATSLTEMMARIGCFDAFIGCNSAATHMAWLQRVPTAMFLGPVRRRTDSPLGPAPSRVLWRGDLYDEKQRRKEQSAVVCEVPVQEALHAVKELLSTARAGFV